MSKDYKKNFSTEHKSGAEILKEMTKKGKGTEKNPLIVATTKNPKHKRKPEGILRLFPPKKFIPLCYSKSYGLLTGTTQGVFGNSQTIRLNSIFEPLVVDSVRRVQGYDQIANIYGKYKVYMAKLKITFNNPSLDGIYCGCRLAQSGNTDFITGEIIGEADQKKWSITKPLNDSGKQTYVYERLFDIGKIEGLTKPEMNSNIGDYASLITTNPVLGPYVNFAIANSANTTNASVNVLIECTYYTQLYDRKILPASFV